MAIKGPLTTPVGGGYRSLNVSLRQQLNLYACIRPVRYFEGVPSPVKRPGDLDIVIFRENTEDVYAGIEWREGTEKCKKVLSFLNREMGTELPDDAALGIKTMSATASKRLVRKAIRYAIEKQKESVTFVHKGNIMKYTEGAFKEWGYQVAKEEFPDYTVTEDDLKKSGVARPPGARCVIKDRIADSMFQQLLTRPREYSVLATPNLNGDYLSDAAAAQTGDSGWRPAPTSATSLPSSRPPTAAPPSTPARTRSTPGP